MKGITKTFNAGTVNEKRVIDGLNLELRDGEFAAIIGANGAGKSTLFNLICGSVMQDAGTIELGGKDISLLPEHRRARQIGRLFQDPMRGSAPGMTIEENLAMALGRGSWFSTVSKADRELFRERLAALDMGLEDRLRQPVGLLSGGQRQALTLVMATLVPPEILLLDEHTAALDPGTAEKVLELTRRIVAENALTCLMITHNMQSALELGSRTIMMDKGKIIMDISGGEREATTVQDLIERFRANAGRALDSDRMLLI